MSKKPLSLTEVREIAREAQQQFCNLSTLVVSDEAIHRGIISKKNVQLVLFVFMKAYQNETLRHWLFSKEGYLIEGRWLQMLAWIMEQDYFIETKKSRFVALLMEHDALQSFSQAINAQRVMAKPIPVEIEEELEDL